MHWSQGQMAGKPPNSLSAKPVQYMVRRPYPNGVKDGRDTRLRTYLRWAFFGALAWCLGVCLPLPPPEVPPWVELA